MSEHLSGLALDELAAGEKNAAASAHLAACEPCRERLQALMATNDAVSAAPEFLQRLEALERSTVAAPREATVVPLRRRWWPLAAAAIPLAAALLVLVLRSGGDDGVRLKGTPSVEVLAADGRVVSSVRPGDRVTLAVGGAGHTHALVLSVDAAGAVATLWPRGDQAAQIPTGARARLEPPFTVTPGSVELFAFFLDAPAPVAPLVEALERGVADAARTGRSPLEVATPEGFAPVARAHLEVAP